MMGWLQKDKKRPQREKKAPAEKPDASDIFLDNGDPDLSGDGNRTCLCLLYTSPSPRDRTRSRMPSSA